MRPTQLAAGVLLFALTCTGGGAAQAAPSGARPHMVPPSTLITLALASSDLRLTLVIDGVPVSFDCSTFSATATTPANGLAARFTKPPRISRGKYNCSDNLGGGNDPVETSGAWSFSLNGKGTGGSIVVPANGATVSSTVLSSCVVILAPGTGSRLRGTYDGVSTLTLANAKIPAEGRGCTVSTTASVNATISTHPGVSVRSNVSRVHGARDLSGA